MNKKLIIGLVLGGGIAIYLYMQNKKKKDAAAAASAKKTTTTTSTTVQTTTAAPAIDPTIVRQTLPEPNRLSNPKENPSTADILVYGNTGSLVTGGFMGHKYEMAQEKLISQYSQNN